MDTSSKKLKTQKGTTLQEMTIYLGVLSIISITIISITFQLVQLKNQSNSISIVSSEITNIFEKLISDIRGCDSFEVINDTTLEVTKDETTSEYSLQEATLIFNDGTQNFNLTTNQINIDSLCFTDWTSVSSDNLLHIEIEVQRGDIHENFQTTIHKR